jgi:hypothetical protein
MIFLLTAEYHGPLLTDERNIYPESCMKLDEKKDLHPFNLKGYYAKMENISKPLVDKG